MRASKSKDKEKPSNSLFASPTRHHSLKGQSFFPPSRTSAVQMKTNEPKEKQPNEKMISPKQQEEKEKEKPTGKG